MRPVELTNVELNPKVERAEEKPAHGFTDALASAVKEVDQLQTGADHEADKLAHGAGNLHETALALEKADLTMRVATKVRNRLVDAYAEIMRMSV